MVEAITRYSSRPTRAMDRNRLPVGLAGPVLEDVLGHHAGHDVGLVVAGGGDDRVHLEQSGLEKGLDLGTVAVEDLGVFELVRELLGALWIALEEPHREGLLEDLGHPAADQTAADDHDPVIALVRGLSGKLEDLGQVLGAGQDEGVVPGKELFIPAGDDGVDPAGDGHHAKVEVVVYLGKFLELHAGEGCAFVDAGSHDLHLPPGDIEDHVAGAQLEQSCDLPRRQFLGPDDKVDLDVVGRQRGVSSPTAPATGPVRSSCECPSRSAINEPMMLTASSSVTAMR